MASKKQSREDYVELVKEMESFEPKIYTDQTDNLTIGYGHKLTPEEIASRKFIDGVDEIQAAKMLEEDLFGKRGYYNRARQEFTNMFGEYNKELGYSVDFGPWNTLSEDQKMMITDYSFNVIGGLESFPKLMFALLEQDWGTVEQEYKRRIGQKELGRNKYIYNKYIAPNLDPSSTSGAFERILNY